MSSFAQGIIAFYIGIFGALNILWEKECFAWAYPIFCVCWFVICAWWSMWREDAEEKKPRG